MLLSSTTFLPPSGPMPPPPRWTSLTNLFHYCNDLQDRRPQEQESEHDFFHSTAIKHLAESPLRSDEGAQGPEPRWRHAIDHAIVHAIDHAINHASRTSGAQVPVKINQLLIKPPWCKISN